MTTIVTFNNPYGEEKDEEFESMEAAQHRLGGLGYSMEGCGLEGGCYSEEYVMLCDWGYSARLFESQEAERYLP